MGTCSGVLAAEFCQLCVFIPQFSVSLNLLKFYFGVEQCGQHMGVSGWLNPELTFSRGGGGKLWVGGGQGGEQMEGGQLCGGVSVQWRGQEPQGSNEKQGCAFIDVKFVRYFKWQIISVHNWRKNSPLKCLIP